MLHQIWPFCKLYQLSERVYSLQEKVTKLENENEKLMTVNMNHQNEIVSLKNILQNEIRELKTIDSELKAKTSECQYKLDVLDGQEKKQQQIFEAYKQESADYDWYSKYGYDWMIADLQMSCVEAVIPGNRRRLLDLKNSHQGESCFIVGNGPSLNAKDLDILKKNHIFSLASKRINLIFNQTDWRPNLWAASDLDYIETSLEEIKAMSGYNKLLCAQTITRQIGIDKNAIYYPFIQMERRPPWFNADIMRGVHFWGTITCKLINFAVYMGFKYIYLLGVDNTFPFKKNEKGKYVFDLNQKSHFSDDYYKENYMDKMSENMDDAIKAIKYIDESYKSIKWHCDFMGITVSNATRGGKLENFPRIDFDQAVQEINMRLE